MITDMLENIQNIELLFYFKNEIYLYINAILQNKKWTSRASVIQKSQVWILNILAYVRILK